MQTEHPKPSAGRWKRKPLTAEQKTTRARIIAATKRESHFRWLPPKERRPHCDKQAEGPAQMGSKAGPAYFAAIEKELGEIQTELAGMNDHIQDFGGPDIVRQIRLEARMKVICEELASRNIHQLSR